jgi:hypothetical protein
MASSGSCWLSASADGLAAASAESWTVVAIGTGDVFAKGRDFAAWLGLVPRQISTGDRTILGKISKRGNRYLRVLFVQAAWVVLIRPQSWERYGFKPLDRSGQEAAAPQRAGDRTCQQARPYRLGGSQQGAQLRDHADKCAFVPTCVSVAPCSRPSRRGLQTLELEPRQLRRPALTVPARHAPRNVQAGTKERPHGTNKGTGTDQERAMR